MCSPGFLGADSKELLSFWPGGERAAGGASLLRFRSCGSISGAGGGHKRFLPLVPVTNGHLAATERGVKSGVAAVGKECELRALFDWLPAKSEGTPGDSISGRW